MLGVAVAAATLYPALVYGASFLKYGSEDCPCVGIDVSGALRPFQPIQVTDSTSGVIGSFPPHLGTECKAWDTEGTPSCSASSGTQPAFCKERWCFVDPCNCKQVFSASTYLPTWKYHKRPLHFSYETCGSSGKAWFQSSPAPIAPHTTAQCSEPEYGIGSPTCPCVGLSGRPGHISLMYAGKEGPYKAEIGSTCSLWENGAYPECTTPTGGALPEWCFQTWCYVDPCNCKGIDEAPRPTQKIAGSNIRGRPMYFSFNTCGGNYLLGDGWVEKSCWTKETPAECKNHSNLLGQQCDWIEGMGCRDGNLKPLCEAKDPVLKDEL